LVVVRHLEEHVAQQLRLLAAHRSHLRSASVRPHGFHPVARDLLPVGRKPLGSGRFRVLVPLAVGYFHLKIGRRIYLPSSRVYPSGSKALLNLLRLSIGRALGDQHIIFSARDLVHQVGLFLDENHGSVVHRLSDLGRWFGSWRPYLD